MFKGYLSLALAVCVSVVLSAPALAATASPGWEVNARSYPTNLPPDGHGYIQVNVYNIGAEASTGTITVTDALPAGVSYTGVPPTNSGQEKLWDCTGTSVVTCTNNGELPSLAVGEEAAIDLEVDIEPGAAGTTSNQATVAGGGAPNAASASSPITLSAAPAGFGFAGFDGWFSNADGTSDTRAGSHPYEVTVTFDLNNNLGEYESAEPAGGEIRNFSVNLPPGLIGDPNAVPQCTRQQFDGEACPADSQIGVERAGLDFGASSPSVIKASVFNMVPPPGAPAEFGFNILGVHTFLDAGVRSGGDYGITEHVSNVAQRRLVSNSFTLWGVPADPSHDAERSTSAAGCERGCSIDANLAPFLTLPTSCVGPQSLSIVDASTWQNLNTASTGFVLHNANGTPTGFTGCDHLNFGPSITVAPDTSEADTPAGLTAKVMVPQEGLLNTEGLATSNIQNTTVVLPKGLVINPGQAAGLVACQADEDGVGTEGPPSCPAASRVGTDSIATPLLPDKLEGDVYVLQSNPPNLQLLVAASGNGVDLKLVGDVHLDEQTGQLTTTFSETPELPFTEFALSFNGGAQAALATPTTCGVYSSASDFTPWSSPFVQNLLTEGSFAIDSGPGGSPCASPLPFSPSLTAGATTDQAGGYTDFTMLLQRPDGQQRISKLQFKASQGLSGMIANVPLCGEPQAAEGTCSSVSQIGHTVTTAGPGPYPFEVPQAGAPPAPIYLTGPYQGAPFGLSIVVPVIAGPFNLGTVIVRAKIEVDPYTAQLTITTGELPRILDGIPTDLRSIDAVIDRPDFMFNPTNCNPMSFSGTATSTEGTQAAISSPFQVGSCRSLKFEPDFKVSTQGKASKAGGASLTLKVIYPTGNLGANQATSQANIASVKVDLPKQLPSRLTTLQKACVAAVFEANPAACPEASIVGHVKVITPVLPVPLEGPAYFVSHGGEAFPSLIFVLQGYGVTIDVVSTTFISSKSITSATLKTVPDVPFSSFELTLPQGPYSALGANVPAKADYSLCGQTLAMPTAFTGQNGAVIHESTPISVSGCPPAPAKVKTKALTRAQKLKKALKACKQKKGTKRAQCEKQARKKYGPSKKKKN